MQSVCSTAYKAEQGNPDPYGVETQERFDPSAAVVVDLGINQLVLAASSPELS